MWVNGCPDVTFSDCAFVSNTLAPANSHSYGGGLYAISSALTLTNCLVEGNRVFAGNQANGFGGGVSFFGSSLAVWESTIASNIAIAGANGNWSTYGAGLHVAAGSATLRNSLFYKNDCLPTNRQAQVAYQYGDGIYLNGGALQILSSTIATNLGQGINRAGGSMAVTNSILWNNGVDVTGNVVLAFSDFGVADTNVIANSCISADPLFKLPGLNDYRLQASSPCINMGTNLPWMLVSLDLAGQRRIREGRVDQGAYESTARAGTVFGVH